MTLCEIAATFFYLRQFHKYCKISLVHLQLRSLLSFYHGHSRLGRVVMSMASHWPTSISYDVNCWYVLICFTCSHSKLFFLFSCLDHVDIVAFFPYNSDLLFVFWNSSLVWWCNVKNREDLVHISNMSTSGGQLNPRQLQSLSCITLNLLDLLIWVKFPRSWTG